MERAKKILIIGKGGREHALGWKLNRTGSVKKLYFTEGNAGTAGIGQNIDIVPEDIDRTLNFAVDNKIDLTIASSDRPLAAGIVNAFLETGLKIFGATKEAAKLEWSKAWAVHFMRRHNIPHPYTKIFYSTSEALQFLESPEGHSKDWVIKPDGLTDGKGVTISKDHEMTEREIISRLTGGKYGLASRPTLIQEKLEGVEVSIFAFSDGENIVPLTSVSDYKQITEDPLSSMTGGMGGFSPVYLETSMTDMLQDVVTGMKEEDIPYKGMLYAGIMLDTFGFNVLEFNARFGDPEAQILMRRITSDLLKPMLACIKGGLSGDMVVHGRNHVAGVVLATEGYPDNPIAGDKIYGLDNIKDRNIVVFHAGTRKSNGDILTTGGRALMITSADTNMERAQMRIRKSIGEDGIHFRGMQYRKDLLG